MPTRRGSTYRARALSGAAVFGLSLLSIAYAVPPANGAAAAVPAPLPAPLPGAPPAPALPPAPASPHPQVTTYYDWDPQPFIVPPTFPLQSIAGEGAGMVTSDPTGTILLFGGLTAGGLTNLTILANETTGVWYQVATPTAPSPRTNFSLDVTANGTEAILFGGEVNVVNQAVDNDTWVFSFLNDTWTNVTGPSAPPPRQSAAFAVDSAQQVALLEGGWEPQASISGGGATVIWNDTWTLNLTTDNWSEISDPTAPRPMYGSSMIFDPVNETFLLFGGCPGIGICSSALFQYRLGHNWSIVPANGDLPTARGASTLVWASTWDLAFLFGGFQFSLNSFFPLNDSYVYDPDGRTWNFVAGPSPPGRFGAPGSFLGANGCPGLLVVGGSYSLTNYPPDGWFLDANPDITNGCNIWGGDGVGGSGPGPGPCTPVVNITVVLESSLDLSPIPNGSVTSVGKCGTIRATTGPLGSIVFDLPNENVTFSALAALFHGANVRVNTTLLLSDIVPIFLTPLPVITVFAVGETGETAPYTLTPLSGVLVDTTEGAIGVTNLTGQVVDPGFPGAQGATEFLGTHPYYSNATRFATIPYTGNLSVNLTLLADGEFSFQAYEFPDGHGIGNASGIIAPVGAYTYGPPVDFFTSATGWFNVTLPQANYTVFVDHPGFVSNATEGPVFHAWRSPTVVQLSLRLDYGANLSVHVQAAVTLAPLASGLVTVGYFPAGTTSDRGWANFTDLLPPGVYNVTASHAGYRSNSTVVDLTYLERYLNVTLTLTALTGCEPECVVAANGTTIGYTLFPGPGTSLQLFVIAPLALVVVAAGYIAYLRRTESEASAA